MSCIQVMSLLGPQVDHEHRPPSSGPNDWKALPLLTRDYQQNASNYFVFHPNKTKGGWVQPDAGFEVNGGVNPTYSARPMLPTYFPIGNRAKGEYNSGKLLNDNGGQTTIVVPPDRYWRARVSPRGPHDVRTGIRESTSKPLWANFTWPLSIGS